MRRRLLTFGLVLAVVLGGSQAVDIVVAPTSALVAKTFKPSGDAVSITAEFEGLPNGGKPYNDPVGYCTQGYGELIRYANCTAADMRRPAYTQGYALARLRDQLDNKYAVFIRRCVRAPITQPQGDALTSFVYNLGGGTLCGPGDRVADTGLARALDRRDYAAAANEFLRWTRAGGSVLPGLVRRREAERKLFLSKSVLPVLTVKEQEIVEALQGWRSRVARTGQPWSATRNRYAKRRAESLKSWIVDRIKQIEGLGSQSVQGRKLRVAALRKALKPA